MRLTTYTDYTLRTLMYLGLHQGRSATIREIAVAYGISKNHLMKVVHQLGLAGLVETVRGRNGGIKLKKTPEEINLGAVIRATEPDFFIAECFDLTHNRCILAPACGLQGVLHTATSAFLNVLDQNTLAGLLKDTHPPAALQIPVVAPIRLSRAAKNTVSGRPAPKAA
jgi:Rrf2 family nitric oxide-sensitive transcriptional repressor